MGHDVCCGPFSPILPPLTHLTKLEQLSTWQQQKRDDDDDSSNDKDSTSWGGEPSDGECPVAVSRTQEESRWRGGGLRKRRRIEEGGNDEEEGRDDEEEEG